MKTVIKDFSGRNLQGQSFEGQDLRNAQFIGADIRETDFSGANLRGADFTRTRAGLNIFKSGFILIASLVLAIISGFVNASVSIYLFRSLSEQHDLLKFFCSLISLVILYFVIYRYGFDEVIKATIIIFAISSIGGVLVLTKMFEHGKFVAAVVGLFIMFGTLAFAFSFIGAISGIVSSNIFSFSFFSILGVIFYFDYTTASGYPYFSIERFIFAVVITLIHADIANRAVKGDKKQTSILKVAKKLTNLTGVTDFKRTDLAEAIFSEATLKNTNFDGADLTRTRWHKAKHLLLANVGRSILADDNVRELLEKGSSIRKDFSGKNLKGANLTGYDLSDINLSEADISGANLNGAKLINANLTKTQAVGTNFTGADLTGSCIEGWNIDHRTKLDGVMCRYIYLLNGKQERRPNIGEFSDGQFSQLFEKVFYTANLILGMRGIESIPSLFNEALKYESCFISYSSRDEEFAKKLYNDLKNTHVRCWFAPEKFKIGDKLRTTIDESIDSYDKILIILSENSIKSNWVEHEIEKALEKEIKKSHPVLFPIKIDEAVMSINTGWPAKIKRERHIGDFGEWRIQQKYDNAFQRLLRDLESVG